MAQVRDDHDIRQALADLTNSQPPVPPGRFNSVRRRAVRHRRRQLGGGVTAAVIIAAAVTGLAGLPALTAGPQAQARHVPGWALAWADHRNGSVPQQVLDRAVLAWSYSDPAMPPDGGSGTVPAPGSSASQVARQAGTYPVVWFAGQTVDRGQTVVAIFEVKGPAGARLVVAQAAASSVMHDQPAWSDAISPWALTTVAAPDPAGPPREIGEYVAGRSQPDGDQSPDNWMVVLTAPGVSRLSWQVATPGGPRRASAPASHGLVVADNGQITSAVRLTGMTTTAGFTALPDAAVGVPGGGPAAPNLAAPPPLSPPATFSFRSGLQGPGNSAWQDSSFRKGNHQYAIYGICYGPRPVQITVDGHRAGAIACNSRQHELPVPSSLLTSGGHQLMVQIAASDLTSWQIDFGTVR